MKKYLNKMKIVEIFDSIISKICNLTVALFWSASYMSGCSQNRDLRYKVEQKMLDLKTVVGIDLCNKR